MKIRQAKKIMKRCYGSPRYIRMILDGLNVSKKLPKIKQYWGLDGLCIMLAKVVAMAELTIVL